jgi:hypothetical protein
MEISAVPGRVSATFGEDGDLVTGRGLADVDLAAFIVIFPLHTDFLPLGKLATVFDAAAFQVRSLRDHRPRLRSDQHRRGSV